MGTVLADHADYRITLHRAADAPTERLVVTFGGQPSGISDKGFGTDFALAGGWDTVFVAQRYGTQYQGLPVEAFRDALSGAILGRDVIAYGSSLGAYAACYYGGSIDARIVAAAPMLPAWPPLRNHAYAGLRLQHRDMREGPLSRRDPVVLYDPMVLPDRRMIEEMIRPAYPGLREFRVPFGGHTVLVTLSRAGLLKPVIRALFDRDELIEVEVPTEGSPIWHFQRGKHFYRTDRAAARAELEKSLAIEPASDVLALLLRLLVRMGDAAAAQALVDRVTEGQDPRLKLVPSIRSFAREAGLRLPD